MSTARTEHVQFGTTRIEYRIRRSARRRTIAIAVHPGAGIVVTAPKGVRRNQISTAVQRKARWIVKQQDWLRRHHPRRPRRFVSGETLLYLGRQYQLRVVTVAAAKHPLLRLTRGTFRVELPAGRQTGREHWTRGLLVRWYRHHALEHVRVACLAMGLKLGVGVTSVRVLDMKTRWGSGGSDGQLRFNWRIIMAPRALMEYVIAHEVCHVVCNRHSPEFWRLLKRAVPGAEDLRQSLANMGPLFDL